VRRDLPVQAQVIEEGAQMVEHWWL
jgi:hypothetical protein